MSLGKCGVLDWNFGVFLFKVETSGFESNFFAVSWGFVLNLSFAAWVSLRVKSIFCLRNFLASD